MARRNSKSPTLRHDASFEKDVFDTTPTNTLQRGTYLTPASPKEHQGPLARFRRSFSSGKDKYKQLYREALTDIDALRLERDGLHEELIQLRRKLSAIANSSPYHVTSNQVGDHNTMITNNVDMDAIDEALEEIEDVIGKLTDALNSVLEERTKIELELENNKVMLGEIQEALSSYSKKFEEKTKVDKTSFKELKTLFMELQSDRSDNQLMAECVEGLQEHINAQNRMVSDFNCLPESAQPGITRLVNKFSKMNWQELATRLGLNPSKIEHLGKEDTGADSGEEETVERPLDRDMCAKIMAEWVKDPNHTTGMLMEHLGTIDKERAEETKRVFTMAVIGQKKHTRGSRHKRSSVHSEQSTKSMDSGITYRERMHRYASQQLGELCSLVLDKVGPMETKIDVIYEKVLSRWNRFPYSGGDGEAQKKDGEEYVYV